ncbi:MAG: LpxL/LpxP family acyltransferase [Thermoanaerobaculia bacterium]
MTAWWRRFRARGVFWRQLLRFAVMNTPVWIEPLVHGTWALLFLLFGPVRRGITMNLRAILPQSSRAANLFRAWRVLWNYAWTIADASRYRYLRTLPDWEFVGLHHFEELCASPGGAIILTAHMGSYDLGAELFAETTNRRMVMVRAPEVEPSTREYEESLLRDAPVAGLRVDFSSKASEMAFDLLASVQNGDIVAIQGDRVTPGIATHPGTLFGVPTEFPAGPFALAMAARVPIYPMFILRVARRRYRLVTCAPIEIRRTSRNRDEDLQNAIDAWSAQLETVLREGWYQWFAFEPYSPELAA